MKEISPYTCTSFNNFFRLLSVSFNNNEEKLRGRAVNSEKNACMYYKSHISYENSSRERKKIFEQIVQYHCIATLSLFDHFFVCGWCVRMKKSVKILARVCIMRHRGMNNFTA